MSIKTPGKYSGFALNDLKMGFSFHGGRSPTFYLKKEKGHRVCLSERFPANSLVWLIIRTSLSLSLYRMAYFQSQNQRQRLLDDTGTLVNLWSPCLWMGKQWWHVGNSLLKGATWCCLCCCFSSSFTGEREKNMHVAVEKTFIAKYEISTQEKKSHFALTCVTLA